jgi:AraC-like DNA-binding protein
VAAILTVKADLKSMRARGMRARPGAHRSDGMNIDSDWHYHDMHQLLYAFEGAIEVESLRGRHLVPRQLAAWIPAGAPHRTSIHRVRSGSVFFPPRMLTDREQRVRTVLVPTLMLEMMKEAMRWPLKDPDSPVRCAFFEAMAKLCGEWITHEASLFLPTSQDPRIKRILDYTDRHMDSELAAVCGHVAMSERSLRRHLKPQIGMTWEDYRSRSRLLRAVSLLSETGLPISEVASRCGFENPSAFAKAFRLAMHETPSHYRRRVGNCALRLTP